MWFLLSLNLSHWIGSFSTVGLDSHLGFRQKGLREAKLFTFHSWEEKEEERRARFSRQPAREDFGGHDYRGAINASTYFEEEVLQHLIGCKGPKEKGTASFIAGTIFEELYGAFITDHTVWFQHDFRGLLGMDFEAGTGTYFEGACCIF